MRRRPRSSERAAGRAGLRFALLLALGAGALGLSCTPAPDPAYCRNSDDCKGRRMDPGPELLCHPVFHACVPVGEGDCISDEQCTTAQAPVCNPRTSRCEPCTPPEGMGKSTEGCGQIAQRPFCVKQGDTPVCVECVDNRDCPVSNPICDGNACRPCSAHKDCGTDVVCDDPSSPNGVNCTNSWVCIGEGDGADLKDRVGRCAGNSPTTGRVVYAKNFMGNCSVAGAATPGDPRCTINGALQVALANPTRVRYVRLLGTIFTESVALGTPGTQLVVIGAPTRSDPSFAEVRGNTTLFQVSNGASLTLDQVKLIEEKALTTVVSCSAGGAPFPSLAVRRAQIVGATTAMDIGVTPAISSSNCDTTLLWNQIGALEDAMPAQAAHATAILLFDPNGNMGRSYRVVGNIIAGNFGPGLSMPNPLNLEFRFNTVVKNGGQVGCPSSPPAVRLGQSIIEGNGPGMGLSQFSSGNCSFEDVVAGAAETSGAGGLIKMPANLDKRYHLTAQSAACLDQVPRADGFPDFDIDGDPRPRPAGGKYDIGADERVP